jgi:hypothetical protein
MLLVVLLLLLLAQQHRLERLLPKFPLNLLLRVSGLQTAGSGPRASGFGSRAVSQAEGFRFQVTSRGEQCYKQRGSGFRFRGGGCDSTASSCTWLRIALE